MYGKFTRAFLTTGIVAAVAVSPHTALAGSENSAKKTVQQMVEKENLKRAEDGSKVVQSGPAKPVENWFGCKPAKTATDKLTQSKPKHCK